LAPIFVERATAQLPGRDHTPQQSPSHVPIPSAVGSAEEAQSFLSQRLRRAQSLQKLLQDPSLRKLAEEIARDPGKFGLTEERLKALQQGAGTGKGGPAPDLNDPRWQELLGKVLTKPSSAEEPWSGRGITPQQVEQWKKLLADTGTVPPAGSSPNHTEPDPPHPGPESPTPPENEPSPPSTSPPLQPLTPGHTPGGGPFAPPPPPPAQTEEQTQRAEWLLQLTERLGGKASPLQQSPAWQQALRDLQRSMLNPARGSLGLPEQTRLADYLHLDKFSGSAEKARSWLPHVDWSKHRIEIQPPDWQAPSLGSAAAVGGKPGSAWETPMWLVVLVALAFLTWRLLAWQHTRRTRAAAAGWKLGPWPVDPAGVTTREELVRAFEYLALRFLGPVVRTWNHREIATSLGGEAGTAPTVRGMDERRYAAAQLAFLYEQARYAPPQEVLPGADLAAARRHLCFLAGVPTA
jgi:hypothetical protein